MVRMCLGFIAFAEPKLTILQLRQAVSTPETLGAHLSAKNTFSERELSRRCSSLIRKSEDGEYFEFAHFSVKEFLEDEAVLSLTSSGRSLESYRISNLRSRTILATQCLRFLQLKNFDQRPTTDWQVDFVQRYNEYPFYEYSALRWLQLTKDGLDDGIILDLAKSLFHPSKTTYFSAWAVEILHYTAIEHDMSAFKSELHQQLCEVISHDNFRPVHLASALNLSEICDYLCIENIAINYRSDFGNPIDLAIASALHIGQVRILERDGIFQYGHQSLASALLPCTERRNHTIDRLIYKGAKLSDHPGFHGTGSLFSVACELVGVYGDFTPIIQLLSLGVIPEEAEIGAFEWLAIDKLSGQIDKYNRAETSSVNLIQYLTSSSSHKTTWGSQIGSILWRWACESNLQYTNDPFLIDSRISLSTENLITKLETAVCQDNVDIVKKCLADGRFPISAPCLSHGKTLLHLAVENISANTIDVLLDAGSDTDIIDPRGNMPIHLVARHYNRAIIEKFVERGISLSSPDTRGRTIWHIWAQDRKSSTKVLGYLYDLDPRATFNALLMKTYMNNTPLSLLLKQNNEFNTNEKKASNLIELCAMVPEFWEKHDPVFGAAAEFGSETVIRCLKQVNARMDPILPGTCTPLHRLSNSISLESVRLLESLCGDIRGWRFNGRLPVELYIERVLQQRVYPSSEVVEALVPRDSYQDKDDGVDTSWEFVCGLLEFELASSAFDHISRTADYEGWTIDHGIKYLERMRIDTLDRILGLYLQLGLFRAYESRYKKSLMIPLLSSCLGYDEIYRRTYLVSTNTLRQGIFSTRLWSSAKESRVALQYLKVAIQDYNVGTVILLLEHGLDIHQRIGRTSPIEYGCQVFIDTNVSGYKDTTEQDSKAILSQLFDKSNKERLIDLALDKNIRLLGRWATPRNKTSFIWLITELINRGVDISAQARVQGYRSSRVFAHLLNLDMDQTAELFLDLCADPTLGSPDAIITASLKGKATFLEKVLLGTTTGRFTFDWAQLFDIRIKLPRSQVVSSKFSAIHLASCSGSIKCLRFYLGEPFSTHVNASSTEGYTPLHMAVLGGNLSAIKYLLDSGALETFDIFGKTPKLYAMDLDRNDIVRCLNEASNGRSERTLSPRDIHALSIGFELGLIEGDLEQCKTLLESGCPIDVPMPNHNGVSPLILSLETENPTLMIVDWLLDNGANVLQLDAIESVVRRPELNPLLPKFLTTYFSQGGDIPRDGVCPLHEAVVENQEGLELLLRHIETHIEHVNQNQLMSSPQLMSRLMNNLVRFEFYRYKAEWHVAGVTALHVASHEGDSIAASLLIEKGAFVDAVDSNGWTPLVYARSSYMAQHLISLGASTTAIYGRGPILSLLSWWG